MIIHVDEARAALEKSGYVVLTAKSYKAAQERHRTARALKDYADEKAASSERWARDCLDEERRLRERLTHVYGVAKACGATDEQLRGPDA